MQMLTRLGLLAHGIPTRRAAFWGPFAGALLVAGGMALWLSS